MARKHTFKKSTKKQTPRANKAQTQVDSAIMASIKRDARRKKVRPADVLRGVIYKHYRFKKPKPLDPFAQNLINARAQVSHAAKTLRQEAENWSRVKNMAAWNKFVKAVKNFSSEFSEI